MEVLLTCEGVDVVPEYVGIDYRPCPFQPRALEGVTMRANLTMNDRQAATAGLRRAEADDAQGIRDPRAQAQGPHGRLPQDRRRTAQKA